MIIDKMKNLLKEYRYVLGIVIILLILVIIASTGRSRYLFNKQSDGGIICFMILPAG